MNDDDKQKKGDFPADANADIQDVSAPDNAENAEAKEHVEPKDPLVVLQEENTDLKDRLLRAVAETENIRRRTEREKSETAKYAISNFARDILAIGDNISRAIGAVPPDATEADDNIKSLIDGIKMTERELANIMERHEIRQISPMGEKFDPNLHQAIFEAPNTEVPPKTVIEVTQIGYIIGDRVLRPAMVGVSTGGPAPVPAPAADTAKTMEKNTDEENSPPGSNIDKSA